MPVLKPAKLLVNRVDAIRQYHQDTGIKRAELDVSGGIDSAVMAGLLVLALGPENVTFAHLAIHSNPEQTERAKRLIQAIGGKIAVADFTYEYEEIVGKIVNSITDAEPNHDQAQAKRYEIKARLDADPTILGSIRSTLRAPLGRAYNRITGGGIRHGTGNECEDRFLRFYQKGGDGEVDTNPIAMLSKAEVYQLAYELATGDWFGHGNEAAKQAYFDTIGAIPSADLWSNGDAHNDEDEISRWLGAKFTYGKLDTRTGKVVNVGTIERVARFLDEDIPYPKVGDHSHKVSWQEGILFGDAPLSENNLNILIGAAAGSNAIFGSGLTHDQIKALLLGAHKAERCTRHKHNPAIPMLGTRADLIQQGTLTDDFAAYGLGEAKAPKVETTSVLC